MDVTEDAIQQETALDEVDIPNLPIKEAERRAGWRSLPQKVRIAIRRLHRQFGHVPQKVLLNLLRSARVSKQYIDAVKYFRSVKCEESAPRRTGHKTSLPNRKMGMNEPFSPVHLEGNTRLLESQQWYGQIISNRKVWEK